MADDDNENFCTDAAELIDRAGLRGVDAVLTGLTAGPGQLLAAVDTAAALVAAALA